MRPSPIASAADNGGLHIERRRIADLKPHPANYNRHSSEQIARLADSLRIHGQQKNISVSADGTILAGHGLVEAARSLGWDSIACKTYDGPAAEAWMVADNYLATLADPDELQLAALLREAEAGGSLAATGYREEDYRELLARAEAGDPANASFPEIPPDLPDSPDGKPKTVTCPECGARFDV